MNKSMKRVLLIILTIMAAVPPLLSQQQSGKELLARQAKRYVTLFGLDAQQGAKFEAMYYAYNKKMHEIHTEYKKEHITNDASLSEEEIEKRILDNFAQSKAILAVRENYYKQFRTLLSPSQINTILEDEKARRAQMSKNARQAQTK